MKRSPALLATLALLGAANIGAAASAIAGPDQVSRGDLAIFALMRRQGFERPAIEAGHGVTLTLLCDIRQAGKRGGYSLYWLEVRTRTGPLIHGRAELVAISAAGHVLGSYPDNELSLRPRCDAPHTLSRQVDRMAGPASITARFEIDQLPQRLITTGNTQFVAAEPYRAAASVDGVRLPPAPRK